MLHPAIYFSIMYATSTQTFLRPEDSLLAMFKKVYKPAYVSFLIMAVKGQVQIKIEKNLNSRVAFYLLTNRIAKVFTFTTCW